MPATERKLAAIMFTDIVGYTAMMAESEERALGARGEFVGPTDGSEGIEIQVDRGTLDDLPFYCVSAMKLSILSLATFGLYELFWFYKNWALVKERSGRDIRPFWRAFFSPLFCYNLASMVNSAAESVNLAQRIRPGPIALIYAGLLLLQRLPDPYWLICPASFVPLVPVVWQIRTFHEAIRPGVDSTIGWGTSSYVTLAVGGTLVALTVIATFGPPTRALRQAEIPSSYEITLVEAGVLEPNERIVFFYSSGVFSILEEGNLLTENRIVSYARMDGELYGASCRYSEVSSLGVNPSENFFSNTVLNISTFSGEQFSLVVSAEDGRDKEFLSELLSRIPRSSHP